METSVTLYGLVVYKSTNIKGRWRKERDYKYMRGKEEERKREKTKERGFEDHVYIIFRY